MPPNTRAFFTSSRAAEKLWNLRVTPDIALETTLKVVSSPKVCDKMRPAAPLTQEWPGCATHAGVRRRVLRKRRCHDQWSPGRVGNRGVITVGVTQLDRGNWSPPTVGILRVPAADGRIRHSQIDESEQPGGLRH